MLVGNLKCKRTRKKATKSTLKLKNRKNRRSQCDEPREKYAVPFTSIQNINSRIFKFKTSLSTVFQFSFASHINCNQYVLAYH